MSDNRVPRWNLGLRFVLELAALVGLACGGCAAGSGPSRVLLAVVFAVLGALVWGVFAVPDDPSRSGSAPVRVPGPLRLLLELLVLLGGVGGYLGLGWTTVAAVDLGLVVVHLAFSTGRLRWLVAQ
jgi:hypothetical protein